jgi:hypothetical protein
MMRVLKEITEWDMPNHTYFVTPGKDKMFAYIKASGNAIEEFNNPLPFSTTRRKFKEITNTWNFTPKAVEVIPDGFVKIVLGSKGERYTITEVSGIRQCSCPGFKFRSKCRHIEQ